MEAGTERRREDLRRLQSMCATSGGRLRLLSTRGDPPRELTLELQCRTAASADYPRDVSTRTSVRIQFPARYPFDPPLAEILTPIYHPNVYASGRICLGIHWLPTEGLDLLVKRIAQIVTFDPSVVNAASAANPVAASWYRDAVRSHPAAFPTDQISFGPADGKERGIQWRDLSAPNTPRRIVVCGSCAQLLRIPATPGVRTRCPKCGHTFAVAS